jgi:hypothetical protein
MEYSFKGLVRHRHVVFKSWHWSCGTGDLLGMSHVKKNQKLEGENTTFGWEKKTKPCLYFFFFFIFFFLEIVVFTCGLWPIKVNSIWCPSLAFNSCSALFCLLFLLVPSPLMMFCHLVWQSRSTWYICSFSPGLLKCFFISLWQTYVYIIIWAEASREIFWSAPNLLWPT